MTKLLVLALCVCLVMSMSVKERLEKSEATNGSAESQEESQEPCYPDWIADGTCDENCNIEKFNFDGGDCVHCPLRLIKNGICDDTCNFEQYNWDDGDCPH